MTTYDIDPRDVRRMADMQTVYRMFDREDRLLYIGRTGDAGRRFGEHAAKRWFPLVETIKLEWFPTEAAAVLAERRAIQSENPRYNKADRKPARRPVRTKRPKPASVVVSARQAGTPAARDLLAAFAAAAEVAAKVTPARPPRTKLDEAEYRAALMALLKESTTASEAAECIGVTKWSVRVHLEALRDEGIARVEGERRLARWVLAPPCRDR